MSTVFKRIGLATTAPSGSGMAIPRSGTGNGGEYGADISDSMRTFAILREPVAYRVVFSISKAIFDNWFTLEGSNYRTQNTGEASESKTKGNEAFDKRVQKLLDKISAKEELTRMAVFERGYGWAIIVLGYDDPAETLMEPLSSTGNLQEIKAFGPPQISKVVEVTDPNDVRYGLPLIYEVTRPGSLAPLKIHYTRVIHFATRLIDHDWKGKAVNAGTARGRPVCQMTVNAPFCRSAVSMVM